MVRASPPRNVDNKRAMDYLSEGVSHHAQKMRLGEVAPVIKKSERFGAYDRPDKIAPGPFNGSRHDTQGIRGESVQETL